MSVSTSTGTASIPSTAKDRARTSKGKDLQGGVRSDRTARIYGGREQTTCRGNRCLHLVMLACGLWARDTPPTAVPTTSRNVPRKRLHLTVSPSCRTIRRKDPSVAGVAQEGRR